MAALACERHGGGAFVDFAFDLYAACLMSL